VVQRWLKLGVGLYGESIKENRRTAEEGLYGSKKKTGEERSRGKMGGGYTGSDPAFQWSHPKRDLSKIIGGSLALKVS